MWGLLLSFLWTGVGWVFRAIVVKFALYTALFLFCSEAIPYLVQVLGLNFGGINGVFSSLPPLAVYVLGLFRLDVGIPMLLSATATGFVVRRLPIIG